MGREKLQGLLTTKDTKEKKKTRGCASFVMKKEFLGLVIFALEET